MTKKLERIYVRPDTKRRIKSAAALEGLDMAEFVDRKMQGDNILDEPNKKKKRGDPFDFPL